ncbi:FAD-dependent oxidoreductase [Streptomyces sp. AHA2]|uniref:FAD-dependent oxidoreductase n=1 Tax=Streptomyces sp. AHA2 TaxID=3064526 RepID=UPI002FDF12CE
MVRDGRPQAVVVGAGPAGLSVAHELARRGVTVRLLDAAPAPAATGRSVAVHPRTLETFAQMGVVDQLLARGSKTTALTLHTGTNRPVRLEADYSSTPTSHPYTLITGQQDVEAVLRLAVARLGVQTEWDTDLTRVEQDEQRVLLHLQRQGRTQVVETSWLIGCDGGPGTMPEQPHTDQTDPVSEHWALAGTPANGDLPPATLSWGHISGQTATTAPDLPGTRRDHPHTRRRHPTPVTHGDRPAPAGAFPTGWHTTGRLQQGRIFITGNTTQAHATGNPQGLNAGVQDAYNLAWKLAQVIEGHAAPTLLDTYTHERLLHTQHQPPTATLMTKVTRRLAHTALTTTLRAARHLRPLRAALTRTLLSNLSGLATAYPASPLTTHNTYHYICAIGPAVAAGTLHAPHQHPHPGERITTAPIHAPHTPACLALQAELHDTRWTLLLAAGGTGPDDGPQGVAISAALQYGPWLSVRTLTTTPTSTPHPLLDPDRQLRTALGLAAGGWLLIRPDGYLAARGSSLSRPALRQALAPLDPTTPLPDRPPHEPHAAPAGRP